MRLPESLSQAIEEEVANVGVPQLRNAAERMMQHYRKINPSGPLFQEEAARLAYLVVRLPATYAAVHRVLLECATLLPSFEPKTLLDLGAGPGTGSWAAADIFPSLQKISLVEKSQQMLSLGKKLASCAPWPSLRQSDWICGSLQPLETDIALLCYLIAEIPFSEVKGFLEKLWSGSTQFIVVVEPGTPAGYERIIAVRNWALEKGAALIAPCSHRKACPMQGSDWCHFPARVERSRLHRLLKSGSLGYEDEKFSYLVFGKIALQSSLDRIVGKPSKVSGFIRLPLCTKQGTLEQIGVARKGENWKNARNAEWGDLWK